MEIQHLGPLDVSLKTAWNRLHAETPGANPFTRFEWLHALEASGCAVPDKGWASHHLGLFDGTELLAALPLYEKHDSDGDFSRDWGWADAAQRAGLRYYPKLIASVPFTPVTGARLLTRAGVDRAEAAKHLLAAAKSLLPEIGGRSGGGSLHVLFPTDEESHLFEALGMVRRIAYQYHFHNAGYTKPDDLLARFDSKRRNTARRERRAPGEQGIAIRTIRGEELAREHDKVARLAHKLHRSTVDKLVWGRRWLNEDFYRRVFAEMPEHMELVVAERAGTVVAGAFNVSDATHLYGRYWGCFEEHPFLHFNVCLYHSIDDVIARGLKTMEGGAGGEHKIPRGFEPSETFSNHFFVDERLDEPLRAHIASEAAERERALNEYRARSPIYRHAARTP